MQDFYLGDIVKCVTILRSTYGALAIFVVILLRDISVCVDPFQFMEG